MESKPPVEAGPSVLIESVVRLLLPPPAREHVLGDLAERYRSPAQYAFEALRTVPFVVASQIRRTSYIAMWPLVVLMLSTGFRAGQDAFWIQALIPAIATLIGFMLRDAYRVRDPQHPWRQGIVDVSVAATFALASQVVVAVARPDWLLAPAGAGGGAAVLVLLYLLRIQNPGRPPRHMPVPDVGTMTIDQLREEAAGYAKVLRRGAWIEIAVASVLVPLFVTFAVMARPSAARIGAGMTVAGCLFVMWRMWRSLAATTPIARDADFATTAAIYRAQLQRHQHALRTIWLWYLLPLMIGPFLILSATALGTARRDAAAIGTAITFVVICLTIVWPARRHAHRMQDRISALQRAEEQR
jgi:hypothetical protein